MSASAFAQQCGGSSSTSSGSSGGGVNCVPEPSSLPLVLLGLVGAVVVGRFLKKK
ncbi:PEP-CTERM sorting domain-containing protein [Roseateles sp.]|uniref:PEP-CTERM sorting domain-containing protein n=1 Tax=Roseateles sp. TaxID=1971397 RepID=UPI003D0CC637